MINPENIYYRISTTEVCDLSCVMCFFNGPKTKRGQRTLTVEQVRRFIEGVPKGPDLWFMGVGELLTDPNALEHIGTASELGHKPCILTNGQLLKEELIDAFLLRGVRLFRFSVDAIDAETFARIRIGGSFQKILDACHYLESRKSIYHDITIEINTIVFGDWEKTIDEYSAFWRGKADYVYFNAEIEKHIKFKKLRHPVPGRRSPCTIGLNIMPSGSYYPCCGLVNLYKIQEFSWLPHIDDHSPTQAYNIFLDLYMDATGEWRDICRKCDLWTYFVCYEDGSSPHLVRVDLRSPALLLAERELAEAQMRTHMLLQSRWRKLGRALGLVKKLPFE